MKVIIFIFLISISTFSHATEGFDFINNIIDGLYNIQTTVITEKKKNLNKNQELREILMNGMQSAINVRNSLKSARIKIEKFKSSNDELIEKSSKLLVDEYSIQEMNYQKSIDLSEKYLNLNDKQIIDKQGTFLRERTEISNGITNSWDGYQKSAMTLTYAMINATKVSQLNGQINNLKLTRKEAIKVSQDLESYFGPEVKKQFKDEDSSVLIVAKMIHQVINGGKFIPLND